MLRKEEAWILYSKIKSLKPKVILELGVGRAGSFKIWEMLLPKDGLLIGIEKWYGYKKEWKWSPENSKKEVHFILGKTEDSEIIEKVSKFLGNRRIDFMFIDASHKYEDVKRDFNLYKKFMRKKGVVAFHDIRAPDIPKYRETTNVKAFFEELKEIYRTEEILIGDSYKGSDGIGVVYLD